ncbi:UPF0184 protein C9orf16-like protein [Frankliniella fusca]|uniref:UPF0184 protein C9orf16-like protein n=1 Tax=Frankliniella fusca TaxID=407009 RepID=A0AAE1H679_9NEOP|nr:UPF0184 protein C9orf16-like protein [Frankliniella fusca]
MKFMTAHSPTAPISEVPPERDRICLFISLHWKCILTILQLDKCLKEFPTRNIATLGRLHKRVERQKSIQLDKQKWVRFPNEIT